MFHGDLRDRIEERARAMSHGTVVGIDTQQLLRAVCGVAFGRARMSAVYRYLRGVDPTTGEADTPARAETPRRTRRCGERVHEVHAVERLLASREACRIRQLGSRCLQERDRVRLCLLYPRQKGGRPQEQDRRTDRTLGLRNLAYGALFGLVGD